MPAIVRIIITQASRWRVDGAITEEVFEEQMRRITCEELEPKGLTLLVRRLPAGRMRFLIKQKSTGAVCEMMDFAADGRLETEASEEMRWMLPERSSAVASVHEANQTAECAQ